MHPEVLVVLPNLRRYENEEENISSFSLEIIDTKLHDCYWLDFSIFMIILYCCLLEDAFKVAE